MSCWCEDFRTEVKSRIRENLLDYLCLKCEETAIRQGVEKWSDVCGLCQDALKNNFLMDFECTPCKNKKAWTKLTRDERLKVMAVSSLIKAHELGSQQKEDFKELIIYCNDRGIDPLMMPEGASL